MDRFLTLKTPEGRYVAALTPAELQALEERCQRYNAGCAARGLTPESDKALLCSAVQYYLHDSARGAVALAFTRFSELRRQCSKLGYVVPLIHGTPSAAAINGVCDLLAEAISAATPLPGEDAALTARLTADCKAAITETVATLNAPILEMDQRPFDGLFEGAQEIPF